MSGLFTNWNSSGANCLDVNDVATIDCIPVVFQNLISAALLFAGVVAFFLILHAGFKFVISSGDPKKVEDSRNTMIYAIVGLIIVLFAFLILNLIGFITGVTCIQNFGFSCP
ncbi:MAG: hypothetical protein A2687_03610 [Candidatus Levybacteria bacterium RIFCSPHIGHO2_01_FULL_38_26]|nr:MAG: hypothetical protein A2687_03610 [Candidatus Levybacteria bacterium RIFCSPHIGHO2_01_FULL_38_26]